MIGEAIKLLIAFGLFCLLISILFRFYTGLYVVPVIQVSPDAVLRFTDTVFLIAISLGVYELVKTKKE